MATSSCEFIDVHLFNFIMKCSFDAYVIGTRINLSPDSN
ncbi:hypothetical protein vBEcoMWL3_gp155c [Escherichia phage vB_EcoM_WL-3]|nr:hypothetical protein vBEcoMWL3_gp155c [Escherichia phage vB_EcoM_WL-3]